jgi:hypothetical protein
VTCASCGATLPQRSDATRLVVCRYCNAHLELGEVEARVLSTAEPRQGFRYAIDDAFVWNGARYVVAARMVFTQSDEDGASETVEYLLWSPRRGSLYLDFDDGRWLLSTMVHVMPRCDDPFSLQEGASVSTWDGEPWTFVESGTGTLAYVDGSLPWVAAVGDRVEYATFRSARDRHTLYEVERDTGETEFCQIRVLGEAELQAAAPTRRGGPVQPDARPSTDTPAVVDDGDRRATAQWLLAMALVAAAFSAANIALALHATGAGRVVLTQTIPPGFHPPPVATRAPPGAAEEDPDDLETGNDTDSSPPDPEEVPIVGGVSLDTRSFELPAKSLLRIDVAAPALHEAWASVDLALVYGDDLATHILDGEVADYDDDDDQGSHEDTLFAWVEQPGTYHLLVRVMGGRGDADGPGDIPVPVTITATSDAHTSAPMTHMAIASGIASAALFVLFLARRPRVKEEA